MKIIPAHCGGGGLFLAEAIVAARACPNIWRELSTLMPHHVLQVLQHLLSERLMLGSDLLENLATEMCKMDSLEVADEIKHHILWNTACALFGEGC